MKRWARLLHVKNMMQFIKSYNMKKKKKSPYH